MRLYRIAFAAGFTAGFVAGTRAGREQYDKMVSLARSAGQNPTVQQAASTVQTQASTLLSSAGQKVADGAPKLASSALHKVEDRIPLRRRRDGHAKATPDGKAGASEDGSFAATSNNRPGSAGR
jgi:hypothetical protein